MRLLISYLEHFILGKNKSTKLRFVILDVNAIGPVIYNRVATRHWDIIYSNFTIMPSTHFELCVLFVKIKQVDRSARVFFKGQWFHYYIAITLGFLNIDEPVNSIFNFKNIRISKFANLTFKSLPVIRYYISYLFSLQFDIEPVFETFKMYKTHTSRAFAWYYTRIFCSTSAVITKTAINFVWGMACLIIIFFRVL